MLHHRTECPHCGNEITVNESKETIKCRWCRRLVSVKFEKRNKKKFNCIVEPMDFPQEYRPAIKSLAQWEDEDIYGPTYKSRNS